MSVVFLKILNISLIAGWMILAVLLLRLILKKAPKWVSCLLWALVALRLLLPFSVESVLSLIPSSEVIPTTITSEQAPVIDSGIRVIDNAVNPVVTETFAPHAEASVNPLQIVVSVASVVWIAGVIAMFIYSLISYLRIKKNLRTAIPLYPERKKAGRGIMVCDEIKTPFILGIFKPVIYLPSTLDDDTKKYVIAHEKAHIKRHDHWWKPLGFLLLSVYWFHPLCWVAYILLCRDIEAACDEKVIHNKEKNYLAAYSQALLDCAVQRKQISACPLAFGENGVKGRVKGILSYKKPAFWIIIAAIVCVAVVTVCFLTNPKRDKKVPETVASEKEESVEIKEIASEIVSEDENRASLGDLDQNGVEDYFVSVKEEESPYQFFWDLEFNGETIYHGKNELRCHLNDAWYLDLDEDGEKEILIAIYPEVNSMPQTQYVALKKENSGWKELENTDVGYESDHYTNAFPIYLRKGKGNLFEIGCEGCDKVIEYDYTEHYTQIINTEEGPLKSTAKDILLTDKYSTPGTEMGGAAAWGVWQISKGTYDGKDCMIATHGVQVLGDKWDIIGQADVYFKYDKNGKIRVLDLEFNPDDGSGV